MGNISSPYKSPILVALKVDGTGTAKLTGSGANKATLTDNGTGDYTITLVDAASEIVYASAMPLTDDVMVSKSLAHTTSVMRFECRGIEKTATQTTAGLKFHSILVGADGNDLTIEITGGATAGSEVVTSTSAGAITIQVETTVSTSTQVYAALINDESTTVNWNAFMGVELVTGATTVATTAAANFTGGVDGGAVDADFDVLAYISEA